VVVLGLLALQLWWAAQRKQRAKQVEVPAAAADRTEPTMDAADPSAGGGPNDGTAAALAEIDAAPGGTPDGGAARPRSVTLSGPRRQTPRLDALIDAIVPLALEQPISGEAVLAHLPPSRRVGSKPFYIEGLDADTGVWDVPAAGHRYSELQAGVQLASRSGALNEIEFSEFMQKVQAYAEAVGASVDGSNAPDMLDVVARARELDALTGPLDAQLTITLRTNGVAWSVSFVQQVAARLGFLPGAVPGRMVLPSGDEGAPPMLLLAMDAQAALAARDQEPHASAIRECTLTLDVPQTPAAKEPFPAWHLAARKLGDELDAALCDDQGQTIPPQAFAEIAQELAGLYQRLEALDLPAGSAAARRLFS
jgi:hypothetical protein